MNIKVKSTLKNIAIILTVLAAPMLWAGAAHAATSFKDDAHCVGDKTMCVCPSTNPPPGCAETTNSVANSTLDCTGDGKPDANCDLFKKYVNPFIRLLTIITGIAVTIGIIWGGIEYSASGGDPQKTASAKAKIRNSIIALLAFFFLYALLKFLTPGTGGITT